jgi:hypothetical protein
MINKEKMINWINNRLTNLSEVQKNLDEESDTILEQNSELDGQIGELLIIKDHIENLGTFN